MKQRREKKDSRRIENFRRIENKKLVVTVYVLLRLAVILTMVAQIFTGNYENVFLCILTLFLFTIPSLVEGWAKIDLPDTLEIIILCFIFAAEILGEIQAYYVKFPYWDTMLHTMNGFLCAAIGFSLVDLLNRRGHPSLHLSPFYMAVTAFCFSMTIGVLWEFGEYGMDQLFLKDTQKDTVITEFSTVMLDPTMTNTAVPVEEIADVIIVHSDGTEEALGLGGYLDVGLHDTMEDLFVNFIGAVVFSTVGFFFVRSRGKGRFARRFIPRVMPENGNPPPEGDEAPVLEGGQPENPGPET